MTIVPITHPEVTKLVLQAVANQCRESGAAIALRSTFQELALDSLNIGGALLELEARLGFTFEPDQLVWCYEVTSIDDLVAVVARCLSDAHRTT